MELRQLKYFVAVADQKNFTRAATQCRIAQPSLSQQIRNLETELGEPLFHRHPRRIELTEAGVMAYQRAREVLEKAEELSEAFSNRQALMAGSVNIGVIPTIAPYLLPPAVTAFLKECPRVAIRAHEAKTSQLLEMIASGKIDLAVASNIGEGAQRRYSLQVKELFRESLLLAVPERHRLAKGHQPVSIRDIPKDTLMVLKEGHCLGDQVLRICRSNRDSAHLECEQLESLLALVAAGLGIAVVPEMAVKQKHLPGLVFRRLEPPEPSRVISILRKRNQGLSHPAAKFIEYILPP